MHKEILKLSIPNILSNVSVPMISTVDTMLMGHLSGLHLGAVGIGAMVFNFIYWNFGFLRMGVTGMTAQEFGKKNEGEQIHLLLRAAFIALMIGVTLIVLVTPIESIAMTLMNVSQDQMPIVSEYFRIRVLAAPSSLLVYVMMGWFLGMQNAIFPLIVTIVINIGNAFLSYYLVTQLQWEIGGVAWGTVIAQYLGLFLALFLFTQKYKPLFRHIKTALILKKEALTKFLSVNVNIFIRTVALTCSFGFFYSQSSAGGETILAVNVILIQLLNWMSYGIDGFAYSAESMVGKYKGADDENSVYKAIKLAFTWGFGFAIVYSALNLFFFDPIIAFYTSDEEIINASLKYRYWMGLFPIIAFACYIWDGVFIGLTATIAMRNTMLFSFIIFIGSYYLLLNFYAENAIWMAMMLFLFVRGVAQSIIFAKQKLNMV